MKKAISTILAVSMAAGLMFNVFAADESVPSPEATPAAESNSGVVITMRIGEPNMTVNGTEREIDPGMGTVPVIINDRTLLPVRAIVEELGGTVGWDAETRGVSLSLGENEILLTIDNTAASLNSETQTLDTAPAIINDRTMLPIRFIAEGFGFNVDWEADTMTVIITSAPNETAQPTVTAAPTESATASPDASATAAPTSAPTEGTFENEQQENRILVVYFSATGNTESLAETIAEVTGADIYEITPAEPYTAEDLNYSNDNCRANREMNDPDARPAIAGTIENIDEYDTIILGYPIWWGTMPRIINTFLDTYDLSGKTVMPFCTSGSSGITSSVSDIREICAGSEVADGMRGTSSTSETEIAEWLGLEL